MKPRNSLVINEDIVGNEIEFDQMDVNYSEDITQDVNQDVNNNNQNEEKQDLRKLYVSRHTKQTQKGGSSQKKKLSALEKLEIGTHRLAYIGALELTNKEFHTFKTLAKLGTENKKHNIFPKLKMDLRLFPRHIHYDALLDLKEAANQYELADMINQDVLLEGSFLSTIRNLAKNTRILIGLLK